MIDRINLIEHKMNEINVQLHNSIEQELDSTLTVNSAVLKAKM